MIGILIRWLVLTVAILLASYLLSGIEIRGFISAFFAAAVLGILNALFRPLLIILTLPINILTLGLFTFIINAIMFKMVTVIVPGFEVHGFWTAIFGALIVSVISGLLNAFISNRGRVERSDYIDLEKRGDRWQ